ncbi:MAG TPA: hypothetical protein VIV60_29805 [Polyangiaceae bacterium]
MKRVARWKLICTSQVFAMVSACAAPSSTPPVSSAETPRRMSSNPNDVRTLTEFLANDQHIVRLWGQYQAIAYPKGFGVPSGTVNRNRARIELSDGEFIYVGGLHARPPEELAGFDGRSVCITGTARAIMSHQQQTVMAPAIEDIVEIVAAKSGSRASP